MMDYGYGGGGWMWVFGALMIGVIVLIGLAARPIGHSTRRGHQTAGGAATVASTDAGGRLRARQILDERYARGELNSVEFAERLQTLGL